MITFQETTVTYFWVTTQLPHQIYNLDTIPSGLKNKAKSIFAKYIFNKTAKLIQKFLHHTSA